MINNQKEDNRYEKTKDRIIRFRGNKKSISDKEIIEMLTDEIEQYRKQIERQRQIMYRVQENKEEAEQDKDVEQIITTTVYGYGKVVKIIKEYKYIEELL